MEYIEIGKKLNKLTTVQSVHCENGNYYVVFKDWQKGGVLLTIEQAKEILK